MIKRDSRQFIRDTRTCDLFGINLVLDLSMQKETLKSLSPLQDRSTGYAVSFMGYQKWMICACGSLQILQHKQDRDDSILTLLSLYLKLGALL